MPLYENAFIYKIKHNEDYEDLNIYIGSTTNFRGRKNAHKTCCNNEKSTNYNFFVYKYIRDNGGWDEWVMIAIEEYPCDSKKKLEIRERYYIDLLRPTLNKQIPTRTFKERYENNKEKIAEYHKERYENNKEKINKQTKEYRENNKEYFKERYENNKEYFKEYYENNKEIINQKAKEYYEVNKEIINQRHKEYGKKKVICDYCGCEIRKCSLYKHQKTKKCLNNKKI